MESLVNDSGAINERPNVCLLRNWKDGFSVANKR